MMRPSTVNKSLIDDAKKRTVESVNSEITLLYGQVGNRMSLP